MEQIIHGDCIHVMNNMKPNSIDMVITSPPYDDLRTYNSSLEWNEEIWKKVILSLYNVVKDGGAVVWIVNDATINGSETGTSFKQALYFKEVGFNIHDTMIWEKPNFSNPSKTRYHQIFEYMFVFSKNKIKTFNPIKDRKNIYANATALGKNSVRQKDGSIKERKKTIISEYGMRFNVWKNNTTGQENMCKSNDHPATFPISLIKNHILSWSNENDIVLDPFAGSGTTGLACIETNRKYILIEKEQSYIDLIKKRLNV